MVTHRPLDSDTVVNQAAQYFLPPQGQWVRTVRNNVGGTLHPS